MKPIALIPVLILLTAVSVSGQLRTFDNFDTAAGVNVILPPVVPAAAKTVRKKNAQGKWVVVVEDKLVKKTAMAKPVQSVSDGLASREGGLTTKLVMGTGRFVP